MSRLSPFGRPPESRVNGLAVGRYVRLQLKPVSILKRVLCGHYWAEVGKEFRGLIDGTVVLWGCGKCGRALEKKLPDLPMNPLLLDGQTPEEFFETAPEIE